MKRLITIGATPPNPRPRLLVRSAPLCALALAWISSASPARAQMMHVPGNDWRQVDRHDAVIASSKIPKFFLELRFGAYQPDIDSQFGGNGPYSKIFGQQCSTGATGGTG